METTSTQTAAPARAESTAATTATRTTATPTPATPSPQRPALSRLVGDVTAFAESVWGREPLRRSDDPQAYADLFSLDAVDELVSTRGLRTPFLRLVKDGKELPERAYTGSGGIGAAVADQARDDSIHDEVGRGATVVLQGLHRVWEPVRSFSAQLAADLGHPVQVNAYITPPQSQGFGAHYDVHDVFVLQFAGEKHWHIHDPVFPLPLRTQPNHLHAAAITQAAQGEPTLDVVLRPGDCLYLPRGYLHSATALGGVSGHLTIGLPAWTRHSVAEKVLAIVAERLAQDERLRESLPLGVDFTDSGALTGDLDIVREAVAAALRDLDTDEVAAGLAQEHADGQRAAPVRPFAQLAASRDLDEFTRVALRGHLALRPVHLDDGGVRLIGRNGRFTVPAAEAPGLDPLLAGETVTPADLAAATGLEPRTATRLVRRLLDAGAVVPA